MVLYGASIAAITRAVAWIQLGEPVTIRSAYASTLRRLGRYIWLMVLALLILLGIALVAAIGLGVVMAIGLAAVAVVLQGSRQAGLIAGVTIGLLFDVGIFAVMAWFGARYALGISACVVEGLKARNALRRSVELSKESRGRIFLLFLLVGVIQAGLLLLTQSAFYTYMFRHHMQLPLGLNILSQITSVATNILVGPILATGLTLFYFDQRVRKEGYDIEWMMQAAGLVLPHGVETPETILPIETPPHAAPAGGALEIAALDQTASLYRSRFIVFFGIASVPAGVVLGFAGAAVLLFAWAGTSGAGKTDPAVQAALGIGVLGLFVLALPLMIGANALSGAAMCHTANSLLVGEPVTISAAFRGVWKRGWQYVGLYLLLGLIVVAAPVVVLMVMMGMAAVGAAVGGTAGVGVAAISGVLTFFAFAGGAVYAVWMLLRLCLAFPVSVVEHAPVVDAIKRAWSLCVGTRWRMLVLFLLGMALSYIASLLLMAPLFLAMALIPGLNNPQHAQVAGTVMLIGMYGASFAVQALTMPVYAIALVLFYYDQRVRHEGFDIEFLMRQAGMTIEPAPQLEAEPWMPPVQAPANAPAQGEHFSETGAATTTNAETDTAGGAA